MTARSVVISINSSWNVLNFRRGLIAALQDRGFRVIALTPNDGHAPRLAALGVEHCPVEIDAKGASPLRDALLIVRYFTILRHIRPAMFLGYTIKPNIYGSLASHLLGIPVINNVTGLGTAFIGGGWMLRLVRLLYRIAFRRAHTIFFQNAADRALFVETGLALPDRSLLIPGSGVNLDRFQLEEPESAPDGCFRFLLIGRLLRDKGVIEFVEAARIVRRTLPHARFQLLGFLDVANRTAISRAEVDGWAAEGLIDYLGAADDVRPFIRACDCLVLPSYREGLPRALLEGAAMGKPLIATDVPGCRDVVDDGVNGYLCRAQDAGALAAAMLKMAGLDPSLRRAMGLAGRAKVEAEYDEGIMIRAYLDAIDAALAGKASA